MAKKLYLEGKNPTCKGFRMYVGVEKMCMQLFSRFECVLQSFGKRSNVVEEVRSARLYANIRR